MMQTTEARLFRADTVGLSGADDRNRGDDAPMRGVAFAIAASALIYAALVGLVVHLI